MEQSMNWSILYVFSIQIAIACLGALSSLVFDGRNEYAAYYLSL